MLKIQRRHVQIVIVIHAILNMAVKWLGGVLVGKLLSSSLVGSSFGDLSPLYRAVLLDDLSFEHTAVLATVVIVCNTAAVAVERALAVLQSTETGRSLRRQVLQRATDCGASAAAESDIGYMASELVRKISLIEDFQRNDEPLVLFDTIVLGLSVALVFVFVWYAGLVVVLVLVVGEVGAAFIEMKRIGFHEAVEENAEQVNARLLDTIKNAVMIRLTDMSQQEASDLRQLEECSDDSRHQDARLIFVRVFTKIIAISLLPVVIPLLAWYDVSGASPAEAFEIGTAVLVTMYLLDEGHKSINGLTLLADRRLAVSEAQDSIDEFLGKQPAGDDKDDDCAANGTMKQLDEEVAITSQLEPTRESVPNGKEIALDKVTVRYPHRTQPAIKDVSRSFPRGKVHGLVGESGSGKSTTMKIVADLLEPSHGAVTIWQGMKIAYVSQDQKLFARSIRENVTYGSTTPVTDSDVWAALEMANIATFVRSLPKGLDEELTDGENMVSGGQLQRLHLAHLFCTWDSADLVLLDECLSALDQKSRDLMIDRLETFLKGKTALVITHHSEMLRLCDQVHDLTPQTEPILSPIHHHRPSIAQRKSYKFIEESAIAVVHARRRSSVA